MSTMTTTLMNNAAESGIKLGSQMGRHMADEMKRSASNAAASTMVKTMLPIIKDMRVRLDKKMSSQTFRDSVPAEDKRALAAEINEVCKLKSYLGVGGRGRRTARRGRRTARRNTRKSRRLRRTRCARR